ncbi:MAG: phosphotransferase family protein [Actinomycetota bacterium]|nr:phosphotransferase [Actinomycetota bacterium]
MGSWTEGPAPQEILASLERTRPDEARVLRWHSERAQERLRELHTETLPAIIIHGDFALWNLRFRSQHLTAILDFDMAHLNHRVADFALSCWGQHDDVVHG